MVRAVIDSNVLLEGITRKGEAGRVIDAWAGRGFVPCASTALALEYEAVLLRRSHPLAITPCKVPSRRS